MDDAQYGFLEEMYAGRFRSELCYHDFRRIDERKVQAFLDSYHEATKDYEVHALEES